MPPGFKPLPDGAAALGLPATSTEDGLLAELHAAVAADGARGAAGSDASDLRRHDQGGVEFDPPQARVPSYELPRPGMNLWTVESGRATRRSNPVRPARRTGCWQATSNVCRNVRCSGRFIRGSALPAPVFAATKADVVDLEIRGEGDPVRGPHEARERGLRATPDHTPGAPCGLPIAASPSTHPSRHHSHTFPACRTGPMCSGRPCRRQGACPALFCSCCFSGKPERSSPSSSSGSRRYSSRAVPRDPVWSTARCARPESRGHRHRLPVPRQAYSRCASHGETASAHQPAG